jgi:general stress protein 26
MALEALAADNLRSLIKGIPYAMLTTQGTDGSLHSRPMVSQDDDDDACLWFFSDNSTHKVVDIAAHPIVNVTYSDQDTQLFVSVSGWVEIVTAPDELVARWRPSYAKWIPLTVSDPKLALLKVVIENIAYWKPPSGWMGRTLNRKTNDSSQDKNPS